MRMRLASILCLCMVAFLALAAIRSCSKRSYTISSRLNQEVGTDDPNRFSNKDKPTDESAQEFLSFFATPVTFYGKVVDQHGSPVVEASIRIIANDRPYGSGTTYKKISDSVGSFSISGIRALNILVEISKEGYYRVPPRDGRSGSYCGYAYGLNQGNGIHSPDSSAPVIFTLYKQGNLEPLLIQRERRPRIPKDGGIVKLPLDPNTTNGPCFLEIQCWTHDNDADEDGQYDWFFKVTVPNGGLVVREDEYDFEAPLKGYIRTFEYDMPKSLQGRLWSDTFEKSFFIYFNNGMFARVHLNMGAFGAHYVVYHSYLNPKPGSRNLEADPNER